MFRGQDDVAPGAKDGQLALVQPLIRDGDPDTPGFGQDLMEVGLGVELVKCAFFTAPGRFVGVLEVGGAAFEPEGEGGEVGEAGCQVGLKGHTAFRPGIHEPHLIHPDLEIQRNCQVVPDAQLVHPDRGEGGLAFEGVVAADDHLSGWGVQGIQDRPFELG